MLDLCLFSFLLFSFVFILDSSTVFRVSLSSLSLSLSLNGREGRTQKIRIQLLISNSYVPSTHQPATLYYCNTIATRLGTLDENSEFPKKRLSILLSWVSYHLVQPNVNDIRNSRVVQEPWTIAIIGSVSLRSFHLNRLSANNSTIWNWNDSLQSRVTSLLRVNHSILCVCVSVNVRLSNTHRWCGDESNASSRVQFHRLLLTMHQRRVSLFIC